MKDNNYYSVQGWMINKLKLSGRELAAFAIIYGFSQDGETEFNGSISYISEWLGCSRPTTIATMNKLLDADLIEKRQFKVNNVTFNGYKVSLQVVKLFDWGSKETLQGGSQISLLGGSKKTLPNNIVNNNTTNYSNNDIGQNFTKPTLEDCLKEFQKKISSPRAAEIEAGKFWNYYESVGWIVGKNKKMKSWVSAIANWAAKNQDANINSIAKYDYSDKPQPF